MSWKKPHQSERLYIYLHMNSQAQARSDTGDNWTYVLDAQQILKSAFTEVIKVEISVTEKIPRYQSVPEHSQ